MGLFVWEGLGGILPQAQAVGWTRNSSTDTCPACNRTDLPFPGVTTDCCLRRRDLGRRRRRLVPRLQAGPASRSALPDDPQDNRAFLAKTSVPGAFRGLDRWAVSAGPSSATVRNRLAREAIMALLFFGTDPNSGGGNCPAVWVDTDTPAGPELVLQGKVADAVTRAACGHDSPSADDEAIIRIPARMMDQIRKACDAAEAASAQL
ncbi:hypothetical protein ABZ867_27485 [Streptomyces cinnamoneus]